MPIYPLSLSVNHSSKSRVSLATGLQLSIPKGHVGTISSHENTSPRELLVRPGILDPVFSEELILLVGNFTNKPLAINPRQPIAFIHLLSVNNIVGVALCGSLRDLSLPNPAIHVTLPALNANLAPSYHAEALSLLEEYADLFSEEPYDFGLIKGTSHQLKLEDSRPFRTQSYQKFKVEETQWLLNSGSFLMLAYFSLPKALGPHHSYSYGKKTVATDWSWIIAV